MVVLREGVEPDALVNVYGSQAKFADWFQRTEAHWSRASGSPTTTPSTITDYSDVRSTGPTKHAKTDSAGNQRQITA
jgi:hypothetical protein